MTEIDSQLYRLIVADNKMDTVCYSVRPVTNQ
jgi:hypothetical protein